MSIIRSTQTIRYFQGVPIMTISTNTAALNATALATRAIHAGQEPDPTTGAVVTPIYMTSTFKQDGVGGLRGGYDYSRSVNPTRNSFDEQLAAVEGARYALSFSSGLAAIDVLLRSTIRPWHRHSAFSPGNATHNRMFEYGNETTRQCKIGRASCRERVCQYV